MDDAICICPGWLGKKTEPINNSPWPSESTNGQGSLSLVEAGVGLVSLVQMMYRSSDRVGRVYGGALV